LNTLSIEDKVFDLDVKPVARVVMDGDWVVLKEEGGNHQILTSQESLETWKKYA